jgi:hypothetical protein
MNPPFCGSDADRLRFMEFGLDATWSGYIATPDILEAKFKELRQGYMALQVIFYFARAVRGTALSIAVRIFMYLPPSLLANLPSRPSDRPPASPFPPACSPVRPPAFPFPTRLPPPVLPPARLS